MTFLAPWALALGAAGALGALLLHLVARHRLATYFLPTARFIPDRRLLVSRPTRRPHDVLLLALRMLLLLAAGAAFARPVLVRGHPSRARIALIDRSRAVARVAETGERLHAMIADGVPTTVIEFDSAASPPRSIGASDTAAMSGRSARARGSISAALVAARRAAGAVASRADSVELVLVSPVATEEMDAATFAARALWPTAIRVERVAARTDSSAGMALERSMPLDDPLGPALVHVAVAKSPLSVRVLRRGGAGAGDSAYARAGGTVVLWDSAAALLGAQGLAVGDEVIVATLGRRDPGARGQVLARWADGSAAAREEPFGSGCIRTVGVVLPATGDLPLRPSFQRIVRGLLAHCASSAPVTLADSATLARFEGGGGNRFVAAKELSDGAVTSTPLVPWLLAVALLCALLELLVRARSSAEEDA